MALSSSRTFVHKLMITSANNYAFSCSNIPLVPILHHSALSLRQFFLSQGDTFSKHGIECQRILCRLDRALLLFARRVFLEKRQKHVAVFLVRLAVGLHVGDLLPRETHFIHPLFCHPRRLSAAQIAQQS